MTLLLRFLPAAGLVAMLAFSAIALANEPQDFEADARQVGGDPPTVPHKIADDATSESCIVCHGTGIKGAPQTSHPDRMGCTQCHVQGEVKVKVKKTSKKKPNR